MESDRAREPCALKDPTLVFVLVVAILLAIAGLVLLDVFGTPTI